MNTNVPQIRFRGFTDPWEQRKLGEIGSIITGNTPPTSNDSYYQTNGTPWITPTDIDGSPLRNTEKTLSALGLSVARTAPAGSILCTCIASIGKNTITCFTCGFNQQINALIPKQNFYDSYFLFTESSIWSQKMKKFAAEATMQIVNKAQFSELVTAVPCFVEQKEIGALFSQLDALITLHQRKYEKLSVLKKSLLEKMFPREGENKPEVRFAGFTDPWEQRKLGEIAEVTMGQSPSGTCYTDNPNDAILVQGNADLKNGWVYPRVWTTEITKTASRGDLIMSVRAPVGAMGKTAFDVVLGRGVAGIKGDEFLFQALSKIESDGYWTTVSAGSTFDSISGDELRNTAINYPSNTEERKRIGYYFQKFDHLITLHLREPSL